jgi:hypothetical protein
MLDEPFGLSLLKDRTGEFPIRRGGNLHPHRRCAPPANDLAIE